MRTVRAWLIRLAGTFSRARRERDVQAELESHLQLHVDDNIRAGLSPAEARRLALAELGGVEGIKEAYRDRGGFPALGRIGQDVRFAARLLRKAPAFSLTAIATIALAVGVNAAIFAVLNAAALQPLPVPESERLVTVTFSYMGKGSRNEHGMPSMLSYPEYEAVRDQTRAFEGVMGSAPFNPVTLGGADPRQVLATLATCNYFDVLEIRPALGRGLHAGDCARSATPVIVLSDRLWRSAFSADPAIVSRPVLLNRSPFVVVGVAPLGFTGTLVVPEDVIVPLTQQNTIDRERRLLDDANMGWLLVMGRRRPDVSMGRVRAELGLVADRLTASVHDGRTFHLAADGSTLSTAPEIRTIVLAVGGVILAAVTLVLLIACANIANLLLARAEARRREIAVRMALGAGRGRLVQQLLTESLALAAIGGALGSSAASWCSRAIIHYVLAHLPAGFWPIVFDPRPDWRVVLYAMGLTTLTGVAFGLAPALRSTRRDLGVDFRAVTGTERRGGRRLQNTLVGVQVAVCMVLVVSAGLLGRGLYRARTIDPGITMRGVSVVTYDLPGAGYSPETAATFQRQVVDRLSGLPGVHAVAEASTTPLSDQHTVESFRFPASDRSRQVEYSSVTPAYFDMLHMPIVRGRNFTAAEIASERAAIVTESTARRLWPGEDALRMSLTLDKIDRPIVGIVRDAQVSRLGRTDGLYLFLPAGPPSQIHMEVLIEGTGATPGAQAIRAAVASFDPQLAVDVARLEDNLELWRAPSRLVASLAAALAGLALVLACTGVFGTVAYAVSRRVREIGIRVALGAAHPQVMRLMVVQGMGPVVIGMAIGVAGAAGASFVLTSMLFGLSPLDPLSFLLLPAALLVIALVACYIPARRALRVEPTIALRAE